MENMIRLMGSEDVSDRSRCIWVNGPVIVGAGPSGLATAACLREQGVPFVVVERAECIASLWQKRTDDILKLPLPKKVCQLPKMPFPEDYPEHPTKRQFIEYLESYATRFDISPQFNECVQSARYDETSGLWRIKTTSSSGVAGSEMEYICRWLVVATGENAERVVPEIDGLTTEFDGEVIHSCEYKSSEKYRGNSVLVVGYGNSGMEVSLDLANLNANPSMVVCSSIDQNHNADTTWQKPSPGILKCNVNANWRNAKLHSGGAWIVRNHEGNVLFHARDAFTHSPNRLIAEFRSIIWALRSVKDLHIPRILLASDHGSVIEAVQKPSSWPRYRVYTEYIKELRRGFELCEFERESPKANVVAREISSSVLRDGRFQSYLARGGPSWLHDIIRKEANASI